MRATPEQGRVLAAMPILAGFTPEEREGLLLFMRERRLRADEVLFDEGAQGDSLFIVLEGDLAVLVRVWSTSGTSTRELSRPTVGEMIGEMACLDPAPRSATIVARGSRHVVWRPAGRARRLRRGLRLRVIQLTGALVDALGAAWRRVHAPCAMIDKIYNATPDVLQRPTSCSARSLSTR